MIRVRDLEIGAGKPKITLPVIGKNETEILIDAERAADSPAEIVEWRADFFEDWKNDEAVCRVLEKIRNAVGEKALLFTFRTADEYGTVSARDQEYIHLLKLVIDTGLADMVDVECCVSEYRSNEIIPYAKEKGIPVLGSNHSKIKLTDQEIETRIKYMQRLGADTVRITTYPDRKKEMLRTLNMTYSLSEDLDLPISIMCKGTAGKPSKAFSEYFGSALVCGALDTRLDPDEINVYKLASLLDSLHEL